MTRSATARRSDTAERISRCALSLADERGLDGFTMDELAEAAEVSRRTLFNYYEGKSDAVLGTWPSLGEDAVAVFRRGGPGGDLVADLHTMVVPMFEAEVTDRDLLERGRRVLRANPRLMTVCHERYQELSAVIVEHIVVREGPAFATQRARVAITLLAALFDAALDEFLDDPQRRPITHHVDESLHTARSLLGG